MNIWIVVPMNLTIDLQGQALIIEQWTAEYAEVIEKDKYKIFTVDGEQIVEVPVNHTFTDGIEAKKAVAICPITIGVSSPQGNRLLFSNNPDVIKKVNAPVDQFRGIVS